MKAEQNLKWLILSGADISVGESPVNRLVSGEPQPVTAGQTPSADPVPDNLAERAARLADGANTLADLYRVRAEFEGCPLKKTAAHTLNGYGANEPDVLCVLEMPNADDERAGRLGGGPAGDLLNKMLGAINLSTDRNAGITTLIPWRAPGNRPATEAEQTICRPFWEKEIALIRPKILLLFGSGVSRAVLGISALSQARNKWHDYRGIPTRVSIPPTTLIRLPAQKKQAWEDLQQVSARLKSGSAES